MIEKQMRGDKKKNLIKVLKSRIRWVKSQREVAEETGVSKSSVDRLDKELGQLGAKIPEIEDICKADFEIVKLTQKETIRRLQNPWEETFTDIIRAGSESAKRYSLFRWNATDKDWGLNMIDFLTEEQKKVIANRYTIE